MELLHQWPDISPLRRNEVLRPANNASLCILFYSNMVLLYLLIDAFNDVVYMHAWLLLNKKHQIFSSINFLLLLLLPKDETLQQ